MSDLKIFTDNIEPTALNQIYTLVKQPAFADCKVRIMPDVHAGAGCVIGFTADLGDKVIPNIVGVDIGCGMLTVELGKIDIDFDYLDKAIRENVPSGREVNETAIYPTEVIEYIRCYKALKDPERLVRSIGSLGGGNHFIEIDTDSEGVKYLVIHTGSRNLGKQVAEYYQNLAIETMQGGRRCLRFRTLRPGSFCTAQTTDTVLLTSVPATRKCSLTALSQKPHTTFGLRGSAAKITESLC